MAKKEIPMFEVPKEFKRNARDAGYVCEHFYKKVLGGVTIQEEEIGSFGLHNLTHSGDPDDEGIQAALCFDCGNTYNDNGAVLEIVREVKPKVPIAESPLFKDVMKK